MVDSTMDWISPAVGAVLGLVFGSFLNVVIHRGPAMWGLADAGEPPRGNLLVPRSYCPSCRKPIPFWRNIPLLSFIILRGRCADCSAAIPLRYLLVELLGAAAGAYAVAFFGWTLSAAFAAVFLAALITLAAIDWETGYLPDALTMPLILAGIIANIGDRFAPLTSAAIGAAAGYLVFWAVAALFQRVRGREGLGLGDAKLLAALGAWSGWMLLAPTVFLGSVLALAGVAAAHIRGAQIDAHTPLPFGPALAIAGAIVFIAKTTGYLPGTLYGL